MKVDAYATMDHWFDHAYALYKHLEPDHRGTFYMGSYDCLLYPSTLPKTTIV